MAADSRSKGTGPREIKVTNAYLAPGTPVPSPVLLEAQGDENALGFSVSFDPTAFTYTGASLGANAAGASMDMNATQATSGKLGLRPALCPPAPLSPPAAKRWSGSTLTQ